VSLILSLVAREHDAPPVIGSLNLISPDTFTDRLRGFRPGLKETVFAEGENWRSAELRIKRSTTGIGQRTDSLEVIVIECSRTAPNQSYRLRHGGDGYQSWRA
jgi:hypothetical protein